MSLGLDLFETALAAVVSLGIAFAVPVVFSTVFNVDLGDKSTGLALMYFVATTVKTYGLRRLFRWLGEDEPNI